MRPLDACVQDMEVGTCVQAQLARTAKSVDAIFKGLGGKRFVIETKFDGALPDPPPFLHPSCR